MQSPADTSIDATKEDKIDVVTALQDGIDEYSLSLFEALRGLRDISTGSAQQQQQQSQNNNINEGGKQLLTNSPGFSKQEADIEAVNRLATDVLKNADRVDDLLEKIPGLNRTKTEQMRRIQELLEHNIQVEKELEDVYELSLKRRVEVNEILQRETCASLGILYEE